MSKELSDEMITEPLISVIIPVYNGEKYISQTIESVLNQPYRSIEVLLINDGSRDKSGEICSNYANCYANVRYFEKENEGIGATRNYGILNATGKYLTFLDQDDVWVKDFLDEATATKIKNVGGDDRLFILFVQSGCQ